MEFIPEKLEEISKILKECKGPKNALASSTIAEMVGIDPGPSNVKIRGYIREVMKRYKIPVGSHSRGFYLVESQEGLMRNVRTLQSRIDEINARMIDLVRFYEKEYGPSEIEITREEIDPEDFEEF